MNAFISCSASASADLGDGEARAIFVHHGAEPAEECRDARMRLVVEMVLEVEGAGAPAGAEHRGRIVAQLGVVHREVDRVEPEAVDAALEPESGDVEQRVLHPGLWKLRSGWPVRKLCR